MSALADALASHRIVGKTPKILTIDIETRPNVVHTWGLFKQNVGLSQIVTPGGTMCFAAKWYGKAKVEFRSDFHDGHDAMVARAHEMLSEADILVHYNGAGFDVKHLKAEFALAGMSPPSPHKDVDLLRVVRSQFRFPSAKLDYVAGALGLGNKVHHEGHSLWTACMAGDEAAWKRMRSYNVQDVRLTEKLYDRLRPWIPNHPHLGVYSGVERCCSNCGSENLNQVGRYVATVTTYAEYVCEDCGKHSRMNHRKANVTMRGVQ